jgi:hypothetical protein
MLGTANVNGRFDMSTIPGRRVPSRSLGRVIEPVLTGCRSSTTSPLVRFPGAARFGTEPQEEVNPMLPSYRKPPRTC